MVRKVSIAVIALALLFGSAIGAHAATVYDGSISSTYVTYFRDILAGESILDNYVAFRSGQYEYTMITGNITFDNGIFNLVGDGYSYVFSTGTSNYNNNYTYSTKAITQFTLDPDNYVVYSDLGNYPQLEERGARYEILSAVLVMCLIVMSILGRIFRIGKR